LFSLQAKDKGAAPGSLGSGHAGGLSLQLHAIIKDVQAQPEGCHGAQPSPPGQQEGRHALWPLERL